MTGDAVGDPYGERFAIDPDRCALLVVDMQRDFVHPRGALAIADIGPVLQRQVELVERCRRRGRPVLFTRHLTDPATNPIEALLFPRSGAGHLAPGGWGAEIAEELTPLSEEWVIDKRRFDAFVDTELAARLTGLEVRDLILCGCQTEICCDTTARSAACRDWRVTLVGDACATRRPELHGPALRLFARAFGQVLRAAEVAHRLQ